MIRLGVLGSTRGTHLLTLLDAIKEKKLHASIEVVISNKNDALILERARQHNIPSYCESDEAQLTNLLQEYAIDLIVLIGYMRILKAPFVRQWENKIINIHPSLLPAFAGKMDLDVHRAVLAAGVPETGCSVHYVAEEVDAGPIILQKKCAVLVNDTVESLKTRVQAQEGLALVEAINSLTYNNSGKLL